MNDQTMLLRQINPGFWQDDTVTSQAFRPTPKDKNLLSVYDGDLISAQDSFTHFTGQGLSSKGVMGLTVAECAAQDLPARPDPEEFREHAVIDFTAFNEGQRKTKAKKLRDYAVKRGWLLHP